MILSSLALVITLLASACGGTAPTAGSSQPIQGTEWQLESLNGNPPIEGSTITLAFEEETAGGSGGCNSYGGSYTVGSDNSLSFSELFQTEMACLEQGIMDQESAYMQTLATAASYQATADRLEILDASGTTVLAFVRQP
jgi:putative lipoprotein